MGKQVEIDRWVEPQTNKHARSEQSVSETDRRLQIHPAGQKDEYTEKQTVIKTDKHIDLQKSMQKDM